MKKEIDLTSIFAGIVLFIIGIYMILIGWNEPIEIFILIIILLVGGILFMFVGIILCLWGIKNPLT